MSESPAPPAPPTHPSGRRGFALPGRLHVGVLFMIQFMLLISVFGGVVPTLHHQGVSTILLVAGSIVFVIVMELTLSVIGRLFPVRCRSCGARAKFRGLGWWPFIYRYDCRDCGQAMRFEVTGG
jgi:hypothetical protein